jgi:hypothetical protein
MNEMVGRRSRFDFTSLPDVDELVDGYQLPNQERKHKSPTKRLIALKNSTCDHKKRISVGILKEGYSQTYCIAPGKSYVIEPQGGELPYEIAEKRPSEFYKTVLEQNIKRYSVNMRGQLTFEWT